MARPQGNDFRVTDLSCLTDLFGEGAYISFMSFIAPVIFMNFAAVKWHERKWTRWESFDDFDLALSSSAESQNGLQEDMVRLGQECRDAGLAESEGQRESEGNSHATTAARSKAVEELRPPALVIPSDIVDPDENTRERSVVRASLAHHSPSGTGAAIKHRRCVSEPADAQSDAVEEVTAVTPSEGSGRRRCQAASSTLAR